MNSLENIKYHEDVLNKYLSCSVKNKKIVFFGASMGLKWMRDSAAFMIPDYVCDNDSNKWDKKIYGYYIDKPDIIFNKSGRESLFVVVTSIYYLDIYKQLSGFSSVYMVVMFTHYTSLLSSSLFLGNKIINNSCNIMVNSGFTVKIIESNSEYMFEQEYIDYTSYLNTIIFDSSGDYIVDIFETKFNLTEDYYKRILSYFLFKGTTENSYSVTIRTPIINDIIISATKSILSRFDSDKMEFARKTQLFIKNKKHALVIHLYYLDMLDDIYHEVKECNDVFDVYVSVTIDCTVNDMNKILRYFPDANIFIFENRGRDILPFLNIFKKIFLLGYETFCKIHSKKTPVRGSDGVLWGKTLRKSLFDNKDVILKELSSKSLTGGFVGSNSLMLGKHIENDRDIEILRNMLDIKYNKEFFFPSGSIYWCKVDAIKQFGEIDINTKYFEIEGGALEGNMEHVIEKTIGLLIYNNGFYIKGI